MSASPRWVRVALARPIPQPYTYAVPDGVQAQLGHVVLAPLGRTAETGFVVEVLDEPDLDPKRIRPFRRLLDPKPAFDAAQLDFFQWVARYYLAPIGMVIRTAIPSEMKARTLRGLEATDDGVDALTAAQVDTIPAAVLREAINRPGMTRRALGKRLAEEHEVDAVGKAAEALVRRGWAVWVDREVSGTKAQVATAQLVSDPALLLADLSPRATRLRSTVQALSQHPDGVDVESLVSEQGSGVRAALRRLADEGHVLLGERERRDALEEAPAAGPSRPPVLNDDQQRALASLTGADAARTWLLHGVTGSGKTEVFLGAARHALDAGRQVCVLVPEIGLTPQLVGRFKARFGDDVAVLHSGLTASDRLAQWRRIRAGEAQVAVGARSALFAPFRQLGLIVVDEEHDDSYKQDDGVCYNARDLAVVLGKRHGCPVVLASATPSMESWFNARQERYGLLRLPKRATARAVPTVELVDLTKVDKDASGRAPLLAPKVVDALKHTFDVGGKAIVLYNRRGFATMVQCGACGASYECPNCGISMTLHRNARVMACHYCGLKRPYQDDCPACGAPELDELGKGTERIEEVLQQTFPGVPIGRMDADTTTARGSHVRILDAFRRGDTRLLVGTQMLAKGHDFPDVHTAVVVSADQGFRMPDFRAAERTWAMVVQLAGRAGRGEVPGRVLVQTHNPDHSALSYLDDTEGFYAAELRLRATLRYPPWTRLVLLRLDGLDRREVARRAQKLAVDLRGPSKRFDRVDVLGPAAGVPPRLVGRWRFQVVLRGQDVGAFRRYLDAVAPLLQRAGGKGVRLSWDVDPRHLM